MSWWGEGQEQTQSALWRQSRAQTFPSWCLPRVSTGKTQSGDPHIHTSRQAPRPPFPVALVPKPEKPAVRFWGAGKTENLCKRWGSCQQDTGSTCQEEKCRHLITPKSRSSMSEEKADGENGRQSERRQVAKGSSPTQTHRDPLGSTKKEGKKKQGWPRGQPTTW